MIRQSNFGAGIALGVGIGTALGVAFHNLALGLAMGAALGVVIGMVWNLGKNSISRCGPTKDSHPEAASSSAPSPRS